MHYHSIAKIDASPKFGAAINLKLILRTTSTSPMEDMIMPQPIFINQKVYFYHEITKVSASIFNSPFITSPEDAV